MGLRPLDQRNLPERVAELLLDRIATGQLSLGSRILEVPLSEELGIARSTVREGLRLLEARGVVEAQPQKGTFVRRYDQRAITSIYALRETTEMRAIALILAEPERLPALRERLDPVIETMERFEARSNQTLNRLDIEFHTGLVEAADDFALNSIWVAIKHHMAIIFSLELLDGSGFAQDHRALLDALETGRRETIETIYRHHVAKDRLDVA